MLRGLFSRPGIHRPGGRHRVMLAGGRHRAPVYSGRHRYTGPIGWDVNFKAGLSTPRHSRKSGLMRLFG